MFIIERKKGIFDFQVHNFREFPGHRSRIIDVRQRVEVEVFSKIVSALCFTKHVVIRVKNLLMQKLNLIITNHATSSIKCKKILTYILIMCTVCSGVQKWSSKWNIFICELLCSQGIQEKMLLEVSLKFHFGTTRVDLNHFVATPLLKWLKKKKKLGT